MIKNEKGRMISMQTKKIILEVEVEVKGSDETLHQLEDRMKGIHCYSFSSSAEVIKVSVKNNKES